MRMFDIIAKKRDGGTLSREELAFAVNGFVAGEIPDYQMSALLMAIYLRGMTHQETAQLTDLMARSGDMVDLSAIQGVKADKHSTGGVGDKTTLIIAPLAAACGVRIAKMSGRGLGHTGGTVDKIESVPGTRTDLSRQEFFDQVNRLGLAVIGQSGNLAPADKKIYALRDVTATISCVPLIASSIMSKKLAAGSDCILLDVKTGTGAFMKTLEGSLELAQAMVEIGRHNGRKVAALITDMDIPLGRAVGNSLEVAECVQVLRGQGPKDLTDLCLRLAGEMLALAGQGSPEVCLEKARAALRDGSALRKMIEMFGAQGGDTSVLEDPSRFVLSPCRKEIQAREEGFITAMDTEKVGIASVILGAGRLKKEDAIDYGAGILIHKKTGEAVRAGESLATFYTSDPALLAEAEEVYRSALTFGPKPPKLPPMVQARVTEAGVERF